VSIVVLPGAKDTFVAFCDEMVTTFHREEHKEPWYDLEACRWSATERREEMILKRGEMHERSHRFAEETIARARERTQT
jgi:hypothetical protein